MASSLALSFRFLDPRFHGRCDGGEPEWPPSPLRAFQALIAAAGAMHRGRPIPGEIVAAFEWLERACGSPPVIVAPPTSPRSAGHVLAVPNNAFDLVARAWARGVYSNRKGDDANPATHRAIKNVRPTRFREGDTVHFLLGLSEPPSRDEAGHVEALRSVARNVVALGWGIDLVAARASVLSKDEVAALQGERWLPGRSGRRGLRVPVVGTFQALVRRHRAFLDRLHGNEWRPPPAFTCFEVHSYRRPADMEERAWAAFSLRSPTDASRFRPFDPVRETTVVAGRMRHVTREAALASGPPKWTQSQIASFVLGHESEGAFSRRRRFAYLPLPTLHAHDLGITRAGAIRRVLVTTFTDDCEGEVAWARTVLAGQELIDETTKIPVALLQPLGEDGDSILSRYVPAQGASVWASVTPVILPGFDDPRHIRDRLANGGGEERQHRIVQRLERRVDALLRKAIVHAGIPQDFALNASIEWQAAAFLPGVEHVKRYRVPSHLLRLPRLHVRIAWRDSSGNPVGLPGPICIGSGRYFGLGLFTAQ